MRTCTVFTLALCLLAGCNSETDLAEEGANDTVAAADGANSVALDWLPQVPFEDALTQAQETRRTVFVYVRQPTRRRCQQLERELFTPAVREFLVNETVPLRMEVDEPTTFTDTHLIDTVPTLLFFRSDGTEVDRFERVVQPEPFLRLARGFAQGRDRLSIKREEIAQAELELADLLLERGDTEAAAAELVHLLDDLAHDPRVGDRMAPGALVALLTLANFSADIRDELETRAEASRQRIVAGEATAVDLHLLSLMAGLRDREDEFLALYDEHRDKYPGGVIRAIWVDTLIRPLSRGGRFDEIAEHLDVAGTALHELSSAALARPRQDDFASRSEFLEARLAWRAPLAAQIPTYYRVLLVTGQEALAEEVAARLFALVEDAELYNAIAWIGYQTGEPTAKHLAYARQADELTAGYHAAVTDTLARIMALRGEPAEAYELVELRMEQTNNENELAIHRETLQAITEDTGYGGNEE